MLRYEGWHARDDACCNVEGGGEGTTARGCAGSMGAGASGVMRSMSNGLKLVAALGEQQAQASAAGSSTCRYKGM